MRSNIYPVVVIALLGLALLASACSPAAAAAPTASNTPTAIVQPTASNPPTATTLPTAPNTPTAAPSQTAATFADPFAYCASVGTIDQPDGRYTGDKVPDAIIQGYIKAAGLTGTTEPMDMFKQTTIWRCMDNKVYACNFGANLPCDSKANTDKTPTQAMADFCKANPDSQAIPMSVTGHETIYSWHCVKDTPTLLDQIDQVDAAGYLARIWYPLEPGK